MPDITLLECPELTEERCSAMVDIYNSLGWGPVTRQKIASAYANTPYYILAEAGASVIGFLRAFSDDVYVSWLAEIALAAPFQGQGVGRAMLQAMDRRFAHTAVYSEALYDSAAFLQKCGLASRSALTACARRSLVP